MMILGMVFLSTKKYMRAVVEYELLPFTTYIMVPEAKDLAQTCVNNDMI